MAEPRRCDAPRAVRPGARREILGLLGLAALLFLEVQAVTHRFDIQSIREFVRTPADGGPVQPSDIVPVGTGGAWIAWMIGHLWYFWAFVIATITGALVLGPARIAAGLSGLSGASRGRWSWPMFGAHFLAFAAFWWISARLFEGGAAVSPWAPGWVVAWAGAGLAVVASLVATKLPAHRSWNLAGAVLSMATAVLVVGAAASGAGWLTKGLWRPLSLMTLASVRALLGLTGARLVYDPSEWLIGTERFTVQIFEACSGYEGIGLLGSFLGAYLWLDRRRLRFPHAWLLLPLGIAAIWALNVARITGLIAIGSWYSADVAIHGFHSLAGWIGFNAIALGIVALARTSRLFRRDAGTRAVASADPRPEFVYLAPLLAIIAASMVGGALSDGGLDRLYPIRLAAVALPLWAFRREYAAMRWSCSWQAFALGAVVFLLWVARWPSGATAVRPAGPLDLGWMAWLAARVVGSAATVPLAEELAFRGFLTRRLISADVDSVPPGRFTWLSFLASSLAFGVLHDRWLEGTLAGMAYALCYYRRGSLGDAVAAHATTNGLLCAAALTTGDWSLIS